MGLRGELVRAVAGADGDGERIDARFGDESLGFVRIGEQLIVRQHAFGAVAVFLFAVARFERAEAAELAFDGDALGVGQLAHFARDFDVVVEVGRRLAVFFERAVHHDGGEVVVDRALARGRAVAVVLVHADRKLGIELGRGEHEVLQVVVLRVGAGAARGLHDDGRLGFAGGFHDRLDLLHVVDVEGGQAVIIFGGVIEQQTHGN